MTFYKKICITHSFKRTYIFYIYSSPQLNILFHENNFTLLFLLGSLQSLSAQCEIPFGDFETWDDVTTNYADDYGIMLPAETILSPTQAFPNGRLSSGLVDVYAVLTGIESEINTELLGYSRSTESRSGDYALKIGGDTNLGFSDLLYLGECQEMTSASTLSYYYKHFGENQTEDIFTIKLATGPSQTALFDADSLNDETKISQYIFDEHTVTGNENDSWKWRQIPIENTNLALSRNAIIIWITRSGAPQKENYWLIDDIQWNIETPVVDVNNNFVFQLGQSLDATTLYPRLDQEHYTFMEYRMYDATGRIVENPTRQWSDAISISHLAKGNYYFQITTDQGTYSKPFVRY